MQISDFKSILEDIIHTTLYISSELSEKQKKI